MSTEIQPADLRLKAGVVLDLIRHGCQASDYALLQEYGAQILSRGVDSRRHAGWTGANNSYIVIGTHCLVSPFGSSHIGQSSSPRLSAHQCRSAGPALSISLYPT